MASFCVSAALSKLDVCLALSAFASSTEVYVLVSPVETVTPEALALSADCLTALSTLAWISLNSVSLATCA